MHFENKSFLILFCLSSSFVYAQDVPFEKLYAHATQKICAYSKMDHEVCHKVAEHFKPSIQAQNELPVLDEKTVDVLELLESNNSNEDALLNKIPCLTEAGQLYAGMKLAFPHSTPEDIAKSQAIVQGLVEHPEVLGQIRTALVKLHRTEQELMAYYGKAEAEIYKNISHNVSNSTSTARHNMSYYTPLLIELIENGRLYVGTAMCTLYTLYSLYNRKVNWGSLATVGLGGFSGYKLYCVIKSLEQNIRPIYKNLQSVHEYIEATKTLNNIIQSQPFLANNITKGHVLDIAHTTSENIQKLSALIQSDNFAPGASPSWNKGEIFAAYFLMHKTKEEMLAFIQAISELDAYAAAAVWYQSHNYQQGPGYSFGQIKESVKPQVNANQSWNMHMDPEQVVVNDINLGKDQPKHVVVSGINEDGKTKIMESFLLNAITSQAFGFSSAKGFQFTPFTVIRTLANITDDVINHKSKYRAELEYAKSIKNAIQSLKPHEKALVFFDEAFATTDSKAGSTVTCEYAKSLTKYSNVIAVYVSFHRELAKMAAENSALFKNYHVVAHEQPDGSFKRTYTLAQGYSEQNDALHLARQANVIE